MNYSINWDLDSIFQGGSESQELKKRLTSLKQQLTSYKKSIKDWQIRKDAPKYQTFSEILLEQEKISNGFSQCISFVTAIQSANVHDKKANTLLGELYTMLTESQNGDTAFSKKIMQISENDWQNLLKLPFFEKIAFRLSEIRRDANELLDEEEENIIHTLSVDGFNAWSSHYDTIVASIQIPFTEKEGTKILLSAGQAFNRMMSDPNPDIRKELFEKWEQIWSEKAPLFADTLNHLDGFRLNNYHLHQQNNFLAEPLKYNRLKQETLDMMWQTISDNKQPFVDYLTRKANLFGKEKMEWQDQEAPVLLGEFKEQRFSFDDAADFIVTNFAKFSPKMADFAKSAFEKSWIEAEDRQGKRPGGYCTSLPESQESRIFMTYGESVNEVATLAHELGHAFHSSVMWDLPNLNQDYAMNVAETASTFAELIVADATLKEAKNKEEKINLLDTKMQNAIAMFLNIHSRFIFEKNYYQKRQERILADEEITDLMISAQREGYHNGLATYHPHFWASKLHFYIDDVPFYNFPYTFGYMFSLGIYAYAMKKGDSFENEYIALLRDTASMTTEELAKKHLDVDLTQPDFWQAGIDIVKNDIDQFMHLTKDYLPK